VDEIQRSYSKIDKSQKYEHVVCKQPASRPDKHTYSESNYYADELGDNMKQLPVFHSDEKKNEKTDRKSGDMQQSSAYGANPL
jgi:hypothetical protein